MHAHALCLEYGVTMGLEGLEQQSEQPAPSSPMLWIEPGAAWAKLTPQDPAGKVWRAGAGCKLSLLQEKGLAGFETAPPDWTVARWLASPLSADWPTGQGEVSCIECVQVMLADGTNAILGPFGPSAQTPLRSLTVQKMVPRLFELAGGDQAQICAGLARWPAHFRLDALMPTPFQETNLGHLLAGHAGTLAWVQEVWFNKSPARQASIIADREGGYAETSPLLSGYVAYIDQQLKMTFDSGGLFPEVPVTKGIESAS